MDSLRLGGGMRLPRSASDTVPSHGRLARAAALLMLLALAGCQSVTLREHDRGIPLRQVDGLALPSALSATAKETVAMLDLREGCAKASIACAEAIVTREGTVREATRLVAASDVLYLAARRASDPGTPLSRCVAHTDRYLKAPALAGREGPLDARTQLALRLHNACTAGLLDTVGATPRHLDWRVDPEVFPVSAVSRVVRADVLEPAGLRTRQIDDGLGVAAVAFGHTGPAQGTFPQQPFALPVNVRAAPDTPGAPVRLIVSDASRRGEVETAFGTIDTARDLSAAYASAAIEFENEITWWQGLRGPPPGEDVPRIRLLAPVDPTKTPVLLIHGLASSPMTWANLVNELQGDPDIAEHYQFWLVRYPTGLPLLYNRQQLAGVIAEFRRAAFPEGAPGHRSMVAIGHSMGGVLTRLLVTDSGMTLWNAAFADSPAVLQGATADIEDARSLFIFSRLDALDEVIFIATPHRGSPKAGGPLSRLVRQLIQGPGQALSFLSRLARDNPAHVRPGVRESYLAGGPASFETLTPTQPVSAAASLLPIVQGVRAHSIIGIKDPRHPENGDGIVSLESASWPAVETHYVRGDHAIHGAPKTVLLIKRILLDRLARGDE